MRLKPLLAGMLALGTLAVAARSQPALDMSRVLQWFDNTSGYTHYTSTQYPLPSRPPSMVHNTMANVVLTNGVAQVVISAGSIVNGCDIAFPTGFGDFFLAWTDPGAPAVPNAAAPAGFGNVTTGLGRGLHLQTDSGLPYAANTAYHCPGPSAQGVSIFYAANYNGASTPPVPTAVVGVDVY